MRALLLCLPLLLSACGDSRLNAPAAPVAPVVVVPPSAALPPVATMPKSACEKAFDELHRKPAALTTAGVVETVQPASSRHC